METKDDKSLDKQIDNLVTTPHENEHVHLTGSTTMMIDGHAYTLVDNYREERYTDILAKYDYIVGDWGFEQLRLHGFYSDNNRYAAPDQVISTLEDYLEEYCNFGCAYFVLEKVQHKSHHNNHRNKNKIKAKVTKKKNKHPNKNNDHNQPFHERKIKPINLKQNNQKAVKVKKHGQRQFAIRNLHDKPNND